MQAPTAVLLLCLGQVLLELPGAAAASPEAHRPGPDPCAVSWEVVESLAIGLPALPTLPFCLWRFFQWLRRRLYARKGQRLAEELSGLGKCHLSERGSPPQREFEGLAVLLKDPSSEQESTEAQSVETNSENLERSTLKLREDILFLEQQKKEEESKRSQQEEMMAYISKELQSMEEASKSLQAQVAEATTSLRVIQTREERVKGALKDALNENVQLKENLKQLSQEAAVWEEQVSELKQQMIALEDSKDRTEQLLKNKEHQVKALTEGLLKTKAWAAVFGEDPTGDGDLALEMKSRTAEEAPLETQRKGALKRLIDVAHLNASLQTLKEEQNQMHTQLSEAEKRNEALIEHKKHLQSEQAALQSQNTQLESEKRKLQLTLEVLTELHEDTQMKLMRKLIVQEKVRLEKEETLSKVEKKISLAAEQVETYRQQAKNLEEELERTTRFYEGKVNALGKKAEDNWLAAQRAERNLYEVKRENAYTRQKLMETALERDYFEDPLCVAGVPKAAFSREPPPEGPSPLGRPSSEARAFPSPSLLGGPLGLSPMLPRGSGRSPKGPWEAGDHQMGNGRGNSSHAELADPQRAPPDTGSLFPQWEQDPRMRISVPGHSSPNPALLQGRDGVYANSRGGAGPANLASFNMPSLDKVHGPVFSVMQSCGAETEEYLRNSNAPNSSVCAESLATGPGFVRPPPAPRGPTCLVDPRSQFMRRGPPFPPPPPGCMCGDPPGHFPPLLFPRPSRPVLPAKNVYFPIRRGIFPSDLNLRDQLIKHFTGPVTFSAECSKHFHWLYHNTRDCSTPAYYKRCARLLTRLAVSPLCSQT